MIDNKKIAIITPFLANGGLEKVVRDGSEELAKYYDVTLIVMDTFRIDYPYRGEMIDLGVSLVNRSILNRLYNLGLATFKLKKLKKEYGFDLVISHGELTNLPNVFSGITKNILVVHENRFAALKDIQGKFVNKIIKYIYSAKNVFKVVTVSEGIRESFLKNLAINDKDILTIYNPYNINYIKDLSEESLGSYSNLFSHPVISITGRLSMQKGTWYLLRIYSELKKLNFALKLIILGDGELRKQLITLSEELGLKTYAIWSEDSFNDDYDVYFFGFQKNPFKFAKSSKIFIMTSLWEGFGNTIVEAMACGTPVISTNCKSGPGEIICPKLKKDTLLSKPNFEGFGVLMPIFKNEFVGAKAALNEREQLWVETLNSLLKNDEKLQKYKNLGLNRANDFDLENIMSEWKILIDSAIRKGDSI